MNRRSLLRLVAGTVPLVAAAGCVETVRNFELSTPVTLNIENETDEERNVRVAAYDLEDDRQTYDESVTATTANTNNLGHLSNADQQVTVGLYDLDDPEELADEESTIIGENTQRLLIVITDEGLELELAYRGREDGPSNESNESTD